MMMRWAMWIRRRGGRWPISRGRRRDASGRAYRIPTAVVGRWTRDDLDRADREASRLADVFREEAIR